MDELKGERERRDLAFENRGIVSDEDGEKVEPTNISQMVSLRLDGRLVTELRRLAESRGTTLSDVLRDAAAELLRSEEARTNRWVMVSYETRVGRVQKTSSVGYYESGDQPLSLSDNLVRT
jgi:predicted transcriptional regulator